MAVYRMTEKPAPSIIVEEFTHYNDALLHARSIGWKGRPLRRITPAGLSWHVPRVNPSPTPAVYTRLEHWEKPFPSYCDPHTAARHLAHLEA